MEEVSNRQLILGAIINGIDYTTAYQTYGRKYPNRGYGGFFKSWIRAENPKPYNSFGNGSAMRVSPVGWAYDSLNEVLDQAKSSAEIAHNHPEGIKGAQATAAAVFLARTGSSKNDIKQYVQDTFGYGKCVAGSAKGCHKIDCAIFIEIQKIKMRMTLVI